MSNKRKEKSFCCPKCDSRIYDAKRLEKNDCAYCEKCGTYTPKSALVRRFSNYVKT